MFLLSLIITIVAAYYANQEYQRGRIGWAMFWSALLGWDLHTVFNTIL